MSESDRPIEGKDPNAERAHRAESGQPKAGRSATVAEIGRELGDLDFEPDDLLASLRPIEPEATGSTRTAAGPGPADAEAPGVTAGLAAPRLPQWEPEALTAQSVHRPEVVNETVAYATEEPSTHAVPKPERDANTRVVEAPGESSIKQKLRGSLPHSAAPNDELSWAAPLPGATETPSSQADSEPFASAGVVVPADAPRVAAGGVEGLAPVQSLQAIAKRQLVPPRPIGINSTPQRLTTTTKSAPKAVTPKDTTIDPNAPDVVTSEDAALLEELVALPPERAQALSFELERQACEHLRERDLLDAYHGIAVVLTREAQAPRHPHEQAELAVVNSELLAMLGELDTAREYLHALSPTSTPSTALLERQLAFGVSDVNAYAQSVKTECRSQISHESRRHLMALYAELTKVLQLDEAEGRKHLELSLRAFPSDPRFCLQRLSDQLKDSSSPSKLRAPTLPDSPQLSEALRDLLALRGGAARAPTCSHPAAAFLAARTAWEGCDLGQLLGAIADLRSIDGLTDAAGWLHACLSTYVPASRSDGNTFLDGLQEQGDAEAELALLERRLHTDATVPTSVEAISTGAVFSLSPADRLALALAVRADPDTLRVLVDEVGRRDSTLALARAVRSANDLSSDSSEPLDIGTIRTALGAAIGQIGTPPRKRDSTASTSDLLPHPNRPGLPIHVQGLLDKLGAIEPANHLPQTLQFLNTVHTGHPEAMAANVAQLATEANEAERPLLLTLAALLAQVEGARELQKQSLRDALASEPRLETAYRSLKTLTDESTSAPSLSDLVERLSPSTRRALLELETRIEDGATGEYLLEAMSDCLTSHPELAPLVLCLAISSDAPSLRTWSLFEPHGKSPNVRRFLMLLEALGQGGERDRAETLPDDIALFRGDPLAHTLLTSLQSDLVPLGVEVAGLDGQLLDWLDAETTANQFPTDLDAIDVQRLSALAERQNSPILRHWILTLISARGGDSTSFTKQLELASSTDSDANFVDLVLEATYLDPKRVPRLGSYECVHRVLERAPRHLAALRQDLRFQASHHTLGQTESSAEKLSQQLDLPESQAFAWLAAVANTYNSSNGPQLDADAQRQTLVSPGQARGVWACRRLLSLAQVQKDDTLALDCLNQLRQTSSRALDTATLTLRAAEAASRLEQWDDVEQLLDQAVETYPEHLVALSMRAEFLEARGESDRAAIAYENLAETACMPAHKVAAWIQAATLWSDPDTANVSSERAQLALERAVELDVSHVEATARLRKLYAAGGELNKLEKLLTRMLMRVDTAAERAQLEYDRAGALTELGRLDEAQIGLERALSLIPSHEPALMLAASIHEQRGDFEGAEQQLLRLAGLCVDTARQVDAYRRLATLYETHLEQPIRAEKAYREVLQRSPNDPAADPLVKLLLRQDNPQAAVELLRQLLEGAAEPSVERARNLELARIFDEVLNDRRRAEEVLDGARRRWPHDAATLVALAGFYRRGKDMAALTTLLDRSVVDARRALAQGRFESSFFEVIACVADLRDETDLGRVARATVSAVNALPCDLVGIGTRAADAAFSDGLAPDVLSLPIRAMLRESGWALCAAHPIELRALRATPLAQSHPELSEHLRELAHAFGLFELDLYLSPALGAVCQPTSSTPPTLVVGTPFVTLGETLVQDALALRALRILAANAAAFANTAPVDLWPLLVAYLSCYLPDWLPPAVDPNKIAPIRERIRAVLPDTTDVDLPMLAAEVAGSIGNRASQLGIAVQQWGSRTALLHLGNPEIVLTAIAAANSQLDRLATNPVERQKWIVRNPEARDLTIFSISDAYLEARAKSGAPRS